MTEKEKVFAHYKLCLKNRLNKKKIELFGRLVDLNPYDNVFAQSVAVCEYKEFFNRCMNEYLTVLRELRPREYERLMLSRRLLASRSKTKNNLDSFEGVLSEKQQRLLELLNEF